MHRNVSKIRRVINYHPLVDILTRAQGIAEGYLTGALCINPNAVLEITKDWKPEIGIREKEFWKIARETKELEGKDENLQIEVLYNLAITRGFSVDYLGWVCSNDSDCITNTMYVLTLLRKIKSFHDGREAFELLSKDPMWIMQLIGDNGQ